MLLLEPFAVGEPFRHHPAGGRESCQRNERTQKKFFHRLNKAAPR
jgi:hypothetical protein